MYVTKIKAQIMLDYLASGVEVVCACVALRALILPGVSQMNSSHDLK